MNYFSLLMIPFYHSRSHTHGSADAEMSLQRDLGKIEQFGEKWSITFNS